MNDQGKIPSIFDYADYRVFLKDIIDLKIQSNYSISYRSLSFQCGFASPSYLKAVVNGERNLTPKRISKFARTFGLNTAEADFFDNLVLFNQSTNSEKKAQYARALLRSKTFQKQFPLQAAEFEYLSQWYYAVIRELTNFEGFKDDPQWISETLAPHIPTDDIKKALELLWDFQFIEKSPEGKTKPTEKIIRVTNEVSKTALIHFHHSMIGLGDRSIERFRSNERDISTVTIAISDAQVEDFRKMIREFREKAVSEARMTTQPNRVYQINIQFFPVALEVKKTA